MKRQFFIGIGFCFLLLIFVVFFFFFVELKSFNGVLSFFEKINRPFEYFSSVGNFFKDLSSLPSLRKRLINLEEENKKLKLIKQEYYSLKEENAMLKTALKLKEEKGFNTLPAKIIFIDPSPLPAYFWINKGTNDGLKEGMNVIDQYKVLIGKLVKCNSNFCQGEFVFSPEKKISVEISGKKIKAIAYRDNNGAYLLTFILKDMPIEEGDLIESSGGTNLLKGFLLAQVKNIKEENQKDQGYKEFYLNPLVDYQSLQNVLVILDLVSNQ